VRAIDEDVVSVAAKVIALERIQYQLNSVGRHERLSKRTLTTFVPAVLLPSSVRLPVILR